MNYIETMELIPDHLNQSSISDFVYRRKVCRRMRIVPPKKIRLTRARVNLNQVFAYLEGQQPSNSTTCPLQSSSNHNIRNQEPATGLESTMQGNSEWFRLTLENIENIDSLHHIPLQGNNQQNINNSIMQNQIHYYTACSRFANKRTIENLSPPATSSHKRINTTEISEVNSNNLNIITMRDVAAALRDCEIDVHHHSSDERSVKRSRTIAPQFENSCTSLETYKSVQSIENNYHQPPHQYSDLGQQQMESKKENAEEERNDNSIEESRNINPFEDPAPLLLPADTIFQF